jgi:hypothetical protein
MYVFFRYAHHVLDIDIVVIFVRRIVTYGVQFKLVSRLAGVYQR